MSGYVLIFVNWTSSVSNQLTHNWLHGKFFEDYWEESSFLPSLMPWKGIIKSHWRKTAKIRRRSEHRLENIGTRICGWVMEQVKIYLKIDSEELSIMWLIGIKQPKIVWSMDSMGNSSWIGARNSLKLLTNWESHWTLRKFKLDQELFLLDFNSMQKDTDLIQR